MNKAPSLHLARGEKTTPHCAWLMGIVNVTDNSFYKGSRIPQTDGESAAKAVEYALQLVEQGAEIIDLGAESTRPGSEYVPEEEELRRLLPVVKGIREKSDVIISIDTRKSNVFAQCFALGADILNDVSALEDGGDELADFCASVHAPVILMHKRGIPREMQQNTVYTDVVQVVQDYLHQRFEYAVAHGITPEKIILDAGIGFGKDLPSNVALMNASRRMLDSFPSESRPNQVLMGLSRKTCIGEMTGQPVESRLAGTLAADLLCVQQGATILRVHDVAETRDTLSVLEYMSERI